MKEGPEADAQVLRRLGPRVLELLARHRERLAAAGSRSTVDVTTRRTPAELLERFGGPLPVEPVPEDEVLAELEAVLAESIDLAHPRDLGHQVPPADAASALGDAAVSLLNNSQGVWEMSPAATAVERRVVGWLAERLGWRLDPGGGAAAPKDGFADGTFVSGGSVANLTALAAARAAALPDAWTRGVDPAARPAVVTGAHAHYCVERALGLLGLGTDALVSVPARDPFDPRLEPEDARAALEELRTAGRTPVALVGCAGSTGTGSVDDLAGLADVAEATGTWLHVDAAHAGALLLSDRLSPLLAGLERADSVALDLHKMAWQPLSAGVVLLRRAADLARTFRQSAPYLFHGGTPDLGSRTLQCSRRGDAVRTWFAFSLSGTNAIAARQERVLALAERAWRIADERPDFAPLHRPQTNILCFRWTPAGEGPAADELHARVRERANRSGRLFVTSTVLGGRRVLRVTIMNPATEEGDLGFLFDHLAEEASLVAGELASA